MGFRISRNALPGVNRGRPPGSDDGRPERKEIMMDNKYPNNYWNKVEEYAATYASFGNDWIREEILDDMARCRYAGEDYLRTMTDDEFEEFAADVCYWYFREYFEK